MINNTRNFCIIAHINHGKSTLADRFLEITGAVESRKMKEQYLDQLELERERGITIKMAPVRMIYRTAEIPNNPPIDRQNSLEIRNLKLEITDSKQEFVLNLIDTPGHSDFRYEVSRALRAVEGAILLIDATQGIQAQTLANFFAAKEADLKVIGVVNKIDLIKDINQINSLIKEIADLIHCEPKEIYKVSAKTGEGVDKLLTAVIKEIPPPRNSALSPLESASSPHSSALVFDSFYDNHKGVVAAVRVFDGFFEKDNEIYLLASSTKSKIKEIGYFLPELKSVDKLSNGEIGYIATGIKNPGKIKIGDTIFKLNISVNPRINPRQSVSLALPGYKEPQPVVFVSFYPEEGGSFEILSRSLEKLRLNDSSLFMEQDWNEVLGRGFKVGFLGYLHFEITAERLKREFNLGLITTFPSVKYRVKTTERGFTRTGQDNWLEIIRPEDLPDDFDEIWEQTVKITVFLPPNYLNDFFSLCDKYHLSQIQTKESFADKIVLETTLPLRELMEDFDDRLKSLTKGYASFSWELVGYQKADLVRVDFLVSNEVIPGLSRFFHKDSYEKEARKGVGRLKEILPRRQFVQPVQARANNKIIAREDIPALKKDVTGYLYGGDRTRKMKLWQKQKRGKKKLKNISKGLKNLGQGKIKINPALFRKLFGG